jgi:hypothetical protein
MKVYDCFTFFNELDLLEFRLKLLYNAVDYFVIAESNLTHAGKPKPYYFEEAKARFSNWADKIIYLPVLQTTKGLDFDAAITTYTPTSAAWQLENGQRMALQQINAQLKDDDQVILSDLDEIPNPAVFKKIKHKIRSFAHTEFNKEEYLQDENILKAMMEGKDIFNRPGAVYKFVSPYAYPPAVRKLVFEHPALLHYPEKESTTSRIIHLLAAKFQ